MTGCSASAARCRPGRLPARAAEPVLFAIYDSETGGSMLWQEMQNLAIDAQGRYAVRLGATSTDGLPVELFAGGAPRWLSVQTQGTSAPAAARTLLTSVPYALTAVNAANADSLGGRPASSYLLTPSARRDAAGRDGASSDALIRDPSPLTSGTVGRIGKFTTTVDLGDSVMFESASRIGIGTNTPLDVVHSRFTDASGDITGLAVQNLSGANAYSGMLFYDHLGILGQFQGFNNSTHEYRVSNIASSGTINFMIGGASAFKIANDGNVGVTSLAFALDVSGSDALNNTATSAHFGAPSTALICRRHPALEHADATLLAAEGWLPIEFESPDLASGMGSGIGQYALYRAEDGSLTLFSLVIPAGAETPVHDHLAWGLIGVYRGRQRETVYRRLDDGADDAKAALEVSRAQTLETGEFYAMLPPRDDIHYVKTVSDVPSVSIHLLANDTACVWRHRFEPETGAVKAFRSGYSNAPCPPDVAASAP